MVDRRPTRGDIVTAAVFTAVTLGTFVSVPMGASPGVRHGADVAGVVFTLAMSAPLALRRTAPVPVLLVTLAGLAGAAAYGSYINLAQFGVLAALASAAFFCDRRTTIILTAATGVVFLAGAAWLLPTSAMAVEQLGTIAFIVVLPAIAGSLLRRERYAARELLDAQAREAVSQERVRIARDLHDIIGHALAGITLQARAGRRRVRRDPAAAEAALDTIDELATRALAETRQAVGLVRGEPSGELRPPPGLEDLDELVADLQGEDVSVELRHAGNEEQVPASVQTAAYRIVQESLSNVVKHAGPSHAVVTVEHQPGVLLIGVRDNGEGSPVDRQAATHRHGLLGIRERAAQVGGSVKAGPAAGGGWRVLARLPLTGPP